MGMDAYIVAIGPYSEQIADHLCYSRGHYAGIPEGRPIVTELFHCPTTGTSVDLAAAFGVDAWDMGSHHLDPHWVDNRALAGVAEESGFEDSISDFLALRDAGFEFYYLPNG